MIGFRLRAWPLALLLCLAPSSAPAQSSAPIVVVFGVEAVGFRPPGATLDALSAFLSGRLASSGRYQVVPREQLKARLVEQKKASYKQCFDQSCQIDLGRELAAQKTIATQVVKVGKSCTVTLNVLDLARAASEGGATVKGTCDDDGLLASLETAVDRLTGQVSPAAAGRGALAPPPTAPSSSPPPASPTAVSAAPACPPGQEVGPDTAGHCCWPGQAWNGTGCVGKPTGCPDGFEAQGNECRLVDCEAGRVRVDGVHCCWPKQAWSGSQRRCLGRPECPDGLSVGDEDETCVVRGKAGIVWVSIPGGTFDMGSNEGTDAEKPVHRVTVRGFQMSKSEVTFGQYRKCVEAGACTPAHVSDGTCYVYDGSSWWNKGTLPSSFQGDGQPVVCVDWEQANAFARWAGGRLPTEAEWEYAARSGGRAQAYPWGNEAATCDRVVVGHHRWCTTSEPCGCGRNSTWPVCSKARGNTAHGLCDMAGNVWEWVSDWTGAYPSFAQTDPTGPSTGSRRVLRGGGWSGDARNVRAGRRSDNEPGVRVGDLGLRLARPAL